MNVTSTAWPADKVERWPVERLASYARNARTHTPEQIDRIAASVREWGWTTPILATSDGMIIAGHARIQAAKKLGLANVPVMVADGWSKEQVQAYVLADNQLAIAGAGWDDELLKIEMQELAQFGFDLELTGFDAAEIAGFLAEKPAGLTDPDAVPERPLEPVSRPGDLWQLGNHRLKVGDCTDAVAVADLLGPVKPHLMCTDPPYGVSYEPSWRGEARNGDGSLLSTGAGRAKGKVQNDDRADWREAWALFPGDVAYVWHADKFSPAVAASLEACGFALRNLIVWSKSHFVVGRGDYHSQHEPCWYAVRKSGKGHWAGDRKQSTIWQIDKPQKSDTGHGTQKPVECMKRPLENNSSPGQAIYDPFVGSGTSIIAAEMTGRHCCAMEIDPSYCDVSIKRWQDFTGQEAVLTGVDRTFNEIEAELHAETAPDSR